MDLSIETSDFKFSLDGIGLAFVSIFMANRLKISVKEGIYYLTKKEIQMLIEYLKEQQDEFKNQKYFSRIVDNFTSMEMLMEGKEKAKLIRGELKMYDRNNDPNRDFYLNTLRNIVKVDDGYCLQKIYDVDENGKIIQTEEDKNNSNKNQFSKNCYRCLHSRTDEVCLLRTKLENCPEHHYIPCRYIANCDAYSPVFPLNIIKSKDEMISFIEKVSNLFGCIEDYESYFGFERRWDEETGKILESVREYYDRGGCFTNIPDTFPCVVYFGIVDYDGGRMYDEKLDWIYIGE